MDASFWIERWREGRIGFHQTTVNAQLVQHAPDWSAARRLLVPLSGKSLDVIWLRDHTPAEVVGAELSREAVEAFHREQNLSARVEKRGAFEVHQSDRITIYCGDFFRMPEEEARGSFDGVYDRAALIALPPTMRPQYAKVVTDLSRPGSSMLLITIEYPQHRVDGPPFSVTQSEVNTLYGEGWQVRRVTSQETPLDNPRFDEAGIPVVTQHIFTLVRDG